MFLTLEVVKSADGWLVRDVATGEVLACEASLLSALAIKAHLERNADVELVYGPDAA